MAKKPAAKRGSKSANKTATPSATSAAVQPSDTLRVITERDFQALLRAIKGHEADKNEAVGAIGGAISRAVEAKHLHKKAFSTYRMCARMSDNKLAEFFAHFDHYRNIGGLDERAATQGNMIPRPEAGEPSEPSARDKEAEAVAGKMGAAQKRSRKKQSDPDEDERQEQAAHANGGAAGQGSFARAMRASGQPAHDEAIKDAVAAHGEASTAKH